MIKNFGLTQDVRAWVKRQRGPDEVVSIRLDAGCKDAALVFRLYSAYEETPDYLGRILFDTQGFWIYDGDILTISEQEQLAKFIINYQEVI